MLNINYEKLLEREPVQISLNKAFGYVNKKRVLVTGGGGSIGKELCRQLVSSHASRLYILGHGENSIYEAKEQLLPDPNRKMPENEIIPVIGEIQDREYMKFLMKRLKADVVFHTAAHKHVPLMEANPVEAIKNNVFGTKNMVEACKEADVDKFVFISSDKSTDPICVYGVSKYLAEEIVLREGKNSHKFLVVRFGNVLGSKGSIIPLFINQIQRGGPVTITDKNTTRFFMTIPEAVSLVLKTGGIGIGSELYLLKMGDPISILNLAERLMETLSTSVDIEFIGLRRGDKLHEKLWSEKNEKISNTRYRGIIKVERLTKIKDLDIMLERLKPICFFDSDFPKKFRKRNELREILIEKFPTLRMPDNEPDY